MDPHSGLGQLSEDTGGFLVRDTNDLRAGFRRIASDMRFYYALGYEPLAQEYDGRFRKVEVKVRRAGAKVRARKGYYAVRRTDDRPVLMFEAPALAQLDNASTKSAFPSRARALSFPEPRRPGLAPVLVEIPGNVLTFKTDDKTRSYSADVVIVARLKDEAGRVVERMSQSYRMSGPQAQAEAIRSGEVLFYREAQLAPGRYTLETVAYDGEADAASVQRSELTVPAPAREGPRLSSIVVVRRAEKLPAEERDASKPLVFGELLLYPNLGEPIRKSAIKELSFFFTVYGARRGELRPSAEIGLLKGGAQVAAAPIDLPQPDASGRIQHVFALPLAQLPPASYELVVTVRDGGARDTRSVGFTVQD
jgi:hypothetical protein